MALALASSRGAHLPLEAREVVLLALERFFRLALVVVDFGRVINLT